MSGVEKVKAELAECCVLAYTQRLVSGTGGNLSVRAGDDIYITATGCRLGDVTPENLIRVSMDGRVYGDIKPSKELGLHIEAYKKRPDISAVVHLHPTYSIIAGILDESDGKEGAMPGYTKGYIVKMGKVKTAPVSAPGSVELAESVSALLKDTNVALMKNHGILAVGNSPKSALSYAEETEDNARLHFLLKGRGALE